MPKTPADLDASEQKMAGEAAAIINKDANLKSGCWTAGLWFAGIIFAVGVYQAITDPPASTTKQGEATPSAQPDPVQRPITRADKLKALEARVDPFALEPLDPKYNPEGFAKLGKRAWTFSNDFRRWAAFAALQSDACKSVETVAVWERATRSDLRWHVGCGSERFIISEAQARSIKARYDPGATPAERREYGTELAVAQPMSAVWNNFNQTGAVIACENLIKEAAVNRNSFETSGLPNVQRDEETGRASIYRDFTSDNAMGGTVSGKYQCVVDASGKGRVLTVKTQDAFGVHVIFDRR